jgi:PAS domain S-box-containing protein
MHSQLFEAGSGNKDMTLPLADGQNIRILVEQEATGILITKGADFIIETVNNRMLALLGKTREQVLCKPLLQVSSDIKSRRLDTLITATYNLGQSFEEFEVPVGVHDNPEEKTLYINFVYQPFKELDGRISGITTVAVDVTHQVMARKQIEEAQVKGERQKRLYEAIMTSTPDLMYVFDLQYRFTYANAALLKMWGKSSEQAIGKKLLENGYEPWHAEMHEREIDQVVASCKPIRGEVSFPHATLGRRIYDYIFVPVLNERGAVEAVAGTTRDITDLKIAEQNIKESEERFRNLADESPMFVFIIDANETAPVSYWNKTWLQYTGQSLQEALGKAWNEIIHPDDLAIVMENYSLAFECRSSYLIPPIRVKRYDGVYRWHVFKGNPRYAANGQFNGYVGVGFDIHEQKLAEEALKQSEVQLQQKVAERTAELQITVEELKHSNTNLEQFSYAASHDLKEPVRKIQTFSELLKNDLHHSLNERQRHLFSRLENACQRMGTLIDDLLSYSHVNAGVAMRENIDLNKKVALVLEDLEMEVSQKQAIITVDPLPFVKGNRRQMQQLFQNLLSNSLKYVKEGVQPEIQITYYLADVVDTHANIPVTEFDKKCHVIEVRDNGIGFDQEDAERIFNVFTRLHGNAEYRGTGVGLAIVQRIVENHAGYIRAYSKPGQGATFRVILPVD